MNSGKSSHVNNENLVITISREHGSGGRVIGEKLAKRLEINCYDKKLIELGSWRRYLGDVNYFRT